MAILKKIISIFSNICFILLIIYALVAAPLIFGYHPVVVLTGSMIPELNIGDVVYYHSVEKDKLNEKDIIAFKNKSGEVVSHRINNIDNDLYETKGDANNTADSTKITYEDILGKITNVRIPILGYYIWFMNRHFYVAIIMLILITLDTIINSTNKKERK